MCILTSNQRIVRIDPASATNQGSFAVPPDTLDGLQASPDGRTLAIVGVDGIVRLLDARLGWVRRHRRSNAGPRVLGFSPDGHRIAVGDANTVLVWRTDAPGFPQRYEAHGGRVLYAAWSADGTALVTGAEDGTVIEWDTTGRHHVGAVLNDDLAAGTEPLGDTRRLSSPSSAADCSSSMRRTGRSTTRSVPPAARHRSSRHGQDELETCSRPRIRTASPRSGTCGHTGCSASWTSRAAGTPMPTMCGSRRTAGQARRSEIAPVRSCST